jgi:hypothetical protein
MAKTTRFTKFEDLNESEQIKFIRDFIENLEDKNLEDDLVIKIFEFISDYSYRIPLLLDTVKTVYIRLVEDMIRVMVSKGAPVIALIMLNKILANLYINIQPQRQLQFWVLCHILSKCKEEDRPLLCDFFLSNKPIDEILQQQQKKNQPKKLDTESQTEKGRGVVDTLYENAGFLQKWRIAKSDMDHKHLRYLAILNKLIEDEKMDRQGVKDRNAFSILFLKKCKSFPIFKNTSTGRKVSYVCPTKNGKKMQTLYEEYQKIMS